MLKLIALEQRCRMEGGNRQTPGLPLSDACRQRNDEETRAQERTAKLELTAHLSAMAQSQIRQLSRRLDILAMSCRHSHEGKLERFRALPLCSGVHSKICRRAMPCWNPESDSAQHRERESPEPLSFWASKQQPPPARNLRPASDCQIVHNVDLLLDAQ